MEKYFVVWAGAGIGGLLRYVVSIWTMEQVGGRLPSGTFVVNLSGSFLIGILMTLLTERYQMHPNVRLFLVVGVLGGYTTFSSFIYETLQSVKTGERWIGLLYVAASIALGYLAVWLGSELAAKR